MAPSHALIEAGLYKKIASSLPVLCVDLFIWHGKELLLVKRKNHPLKGHWWVVGGRIFLGEEPIEAAYRKAKEEAGVMLREPPRFIGYYSDTFKQNAFQKCECQTVSLVFHCEAASKDVVLDDQSSDYKWAYEIPERLRAKLRPGLSYWNSAFCR